MYRWFVLLALCSCGPDPTSSTTFTWFDYCKINTVPIINEATCANAYHIQCLDGDNSWSEVNALGIEGLGMQCFRDETGTYLYICQLDQSNKAVVRCAH